MVNFIPCSENLFYPEKFLKKIQKILYIKIYIKKPFIISATNWRKVDNIMRKGKSYHIYLKDSTYRDIVLMANHSEHDSVSDALEEAIMDVYKNLCKKSV